MEKNYPFIDKMVIITLFLFAIFSMFSISIAQSACGLGALLWLVRSYLTNTWKDQHWPLLIPFLLFIFASLLAVANSYDISYSYKSLKKLLEILIFFWVLNCVRENSLRDSLVLALIASATLASLFGFYQTWSDFELNYQDTGGLTSISRAEGTLSTYMTFAGLLMMVGVMALSRVMFRHPIQKWAWVPICIIITCLLFTLTRQAWLGLLTGLVFLVFFWKKKFLWLLPIILLAVYIASPLPIQQRLKDMVSGNDATFAMRTALWKGGWNIFNDYPLTGCGFRCVDLVNSQYPDPTGHIKNIRGMHNNFIQLAVDTGIVGLATWIGIWCCFYRLLFRQLKNSTPDAQQSWVCFGSAATVLAFLAGGCFESNFYDSEVVMVLYFIMALPFACYPKKLSVKIFSYNQT